MDRRRWYRKEIITIPRWLYNIQNDIQDEVVLVAQRSGKSYLAACIAVANFFKGILKDD